MTGAIIILAVTALTGLVLFLTHRNEDGAEQPDLPPENAPRTHGDREECCGRHVVCDKFPASAGPVYFDDEELDRFAGRDPEKYTGEEVEEFREVLYTLLPSDVYPWGASLTIRDIALPVELRDEWIMLCEKE